MTNFGFYKLSIFLSRFFVVLVLASFRNAQVNAFSVVRGKVDTFSNPDTLCRPTGCQGSQLNGFGGCSNGDCCSCKCSTEAPTYLLHANKCVPNDEVDAECELRTWPSKMAVKNMSMAGRLTFGGEAEGCSGGMVLKQWSYRLDKPRAIIGQPNNFSVTVNGPYLWTLQWDTGLDERYSGLILKFDMECGSQSQYASTLCLLVKSQGMYTLPAASNTDPSLQVLPSDVAVVVTEELEPTEQRERNDTEPDDFETIAQTKREVAEKNNSVVAVGVSLSLVAGVALICVVVLRRGGPAGAKARGKPAEPAYEEPVIPVKRDSITFHNEFYDTDCVLSIDGQTAAPASNRKSRLGPLPAVPGTEEGIYEPVIVRSAGYQGLTPENRETDGQTKEEPKIEEDLAPFYNTLEPPPDDEDDGYDDVVERGCSEA